jgi:hypothetical protein
MSDLIPESGKRWAGLIVSVLVVVLGAMSEWGELGPEFVRWVGRGALLLVVVSNVLGLSVPSVRPRTAGRAGVLAIALALMMSAACPNAYRGGWVATASVMDARDATDDGLAKAFRAKVRACVDKHGSKTIEYQTCIQDSNEFKAMSAWRVHALPAINSAVRAAKEILEIAERVNASGASASAKALSALKDAACGLIEIVKEWNGLFPDKAKIALAYLDSVKGLVCK